MRVDQDECYPPYPLPHKQSFGILSFTPAKFTKFPETLLSYSIFVLMNEKVGRSGSYPPIATILIKLHSLALPFTL